MFNALAFQSLCLVPNKIDFALGPMNWSSWCCIHFQFSFTEIGFKPYHFVFGKKTRNDGRSKLLI